MEWYEIATYSPRITVTVHVIGLDLNLIWTWMKVKCSEPVWVSTEWNVSNVRLFLLSYRSLYRFIYHEVQSRQLVFWFVTVCVECGVILCGLLTLYRSVFWIIVLLNGMTVWNYQFLDGIISKNIHILRVSIYYLYIICLRSGAFLHIFADDIRRLET